MPPSLRHSVDSGRLRSIDFCHRLLGYNNDAYAFGFFYNTPDNTLPIFWSDHGDWKPIMKRYDKKYTNGGYHELGAYV